MFGLVAVGYMWCQMAKLARDKRNGDAFYDTKLKTARFYVQKVLPDSAGLFLKIMAGKGTVMAPRRGGILVQRPFLVMAGLDPAIHGPTPHVADMDARNKSGQSKY